jgi:hypothetical protein
MQPSVLPAVFPWGRINFSRVSQLVVGSTPSSAPTSARLRTGSLWMPAPTSAPRIFETYLDEEHMDPWTELILKPQPTSSIPPRKMVSLEEHKIKTPRGKIKALSCNSPRARVHHAAVKKQAVPYLVLG